MFTVYAIKSTTHNFIYVGMTENLEERLSRHNNGYVQSTKNFRPFTLIHQEQAVDGTQARIREKFLKSGKGREFIKKLDIKPCKVAKSIGAGSP